MPLALAGCGGSTATAALHPSGAPTTGIGSGATGAGGTGGTTPATGPTAGLAPTALPSAAGSQTSDGRSGRSQTSAPPTAGATGFTPAKLALHTCDGTFECATLTVPQDYAKPAGATFALSVLELPAAMPSERIGTLFVNPGGPGGSGVQFLEQQSDTFTQNLRDHFDLITFDPRGVGASDGVHCATDSQLDAYLADNPDPATPALRATYDKATKALVAGCESMSGSELAHVGTADAARDIETLRRALGQTTISYFGYSYGTYLGTVLLAQDAAHVRVAVLDGAVDPAQNLTGFVSGQGISFEAELDRWFAWCQATPTCEFRNDPSGNNASVSARWDALDAQAAKTPLQADGRTMDSAEFTTGTSLAMYSTSFWPELGTALAEEAAGQATDMFALADQYNSRSANGTYDDSLDANTAINCLDHTGPATTAGYFAAAQQVRKSAPRLGPGIVYQQSSCAYWPIKASPPPTTVAAGGPPTVVVGSTHDPATPYVWAQALAKDIPGAVLLTRDGDGHTSYGPDAPCIQKIVDAALINAKAPAAGQTCSP